MTKRILIFSLAYFPFIGGAEVAIDETTTRINENECEFNLITLVFDKTLPRYEKRNHVHIYRVGWGMRNQKISESLHWFLALQKILFPIIALPRALSLIFTKKIDSYWFMLLNTSTPIWYLLPRRKTVLSLQDGRTIAEHFSGVRSILYSIFMRIIRSVYIVQGISNFIVNDVKKYRSIKTIMIPNGVDMHAFSATTTSEDRNRIRVTFGFSENDKVICTVSRLVPSRGVEDAIKGLLHLPEEYKLLIIGEGHERELLEILVRDNDLARRVVFAGQLSHKELPGVLRSCDVFIRVSRHEGMGNAFVEAMASGLPVVGTAVGGIPDFLIEGETGYFCESDNPKSVARAIINAISNKEVLIAKGKIVVSDRYNWESITRSMKDLFLL